MKFCKDCKHFNGGECHAPQNLTEKLDPVTGNQKQKYQWAANCREFINGCGPEAEWFEASNA